MRNMGRQIALGTIALVFLWAGSAQAAKNVIIMIGDGMGPEQVQAGRLLLDPGEEFAMDLLDGDPAFATTHEEDGRITDSAAAGTALATGEKTVYGNVSMERDEETFIPTSMELAQDEGMATGILSDVYMCDATPGVWLAHYWRRSCVREEDDGSIGGIVPQQVEACPDVFLGAAKEYVKKGQGGYDYIKELVKECGYERVRDASELASAQAPDGKLLYLEGGYTLMYDIDRQNDPGNNLPTLAEMTAKAIEVLSRDPDGFMLVVEGGGIDWMAHNKDVAGIARGVVAFDEAVAVARDFAMADGDTLLVVTADHETGGLDLGGSPNVEFIEGVTASTDFMYGLVLRGEMSVEDVLATYAGVTDLTQAEKDAIAAHGEMGISDALSLRANVVWWLPDGTQAIAPDEGDHTYTRVPVFAYGPGSDGLEDDIDNTDIGKALFEAVEGN